MNQDFKSERESADFSALPAGPKSGRVVMSLELFDGMMSTSTTLSAFVHYEPERGLCDHSP